MLDLNALPLPELFSRLVADGSLARLLALARGEDLGEAGDVTTTSIIDAGRDARATLLARASGTVAGLVATDAVLQAFETRLAFEPATRDGCLCDRGETLGFVDGPLVEILRVERTWLNALGRLSGIATETRRYVEAVAGTGAVICDTRKTTPGWRVLEKYAVRCGGATLHRLGLHDAVLYKDNHLAGLPLSAWPETLSRAIRSARDGRHLRFVEVEVDTLEQLEVVLSLEPGLIDMVLLDNMRLESLREAIAMRAACAPHVQLEASGGVDLSTVRAVAETGVDRISVGGLTHSASSLDVALEIEGDRDA